MTEIWLLNKKCSFSDDFVASIRANRSENGEELMFARQSLVTHASAFDLQSIDMVYINFNNLEGLKQNSIQGANLGFTGKQVKFLFMLTVDLRYGLSPIAKNRNFFRLSTQRISKSSRKFLLQVKKKFLGPLSWLNNLLCTKCLVKEPLHLEAKWSTCRL